MFILFPYTLLYNIPIVLSPPVSLLYLLQPDWLGLRFSGYGILSSALLLHRSPSHFYYLLFLSAAFWGAYAVRGSYRGIYRC